MMHREVILSILLLVCVVHAALRSETLPRQNGPITTVVGETYNDVTLDDGKDVLLYHYDPHCRPCTTFSIFWDEVGDLYSEWSDKIVIAKFNIVANDAPELIEATPLIRLFPARAKSSRVDYGGERDLEEFAMFVRENGGHHVDIGKTSDEFEHGTKRYESKVQALLEASYRDKPSIKSRNEL